MHISRDSLAQGNTSLVLLNFSSIDHDLATKRVLVPVSNGRDLSDGCDLQAPILPMHYKRTQALAL
jgi:hypothetical protein